MDPISALDAGRRPAAAVLDGYPVAWRRAEPGWDTGWKILDQHLFHLVDAGEMLLDAGLGTQTLGPGTALLLPPGVRFRAWAGRRLPHWWRLRLVLPAPWDGAWVTAGCRDLEPVVTRLAAEAAAGPPGDAAAQRGGLLVLLAGLRRRQAAAAPGRLDEARIRDLERFVAAQPRATPRDLARRLGLSHDYATRLIRANLGQAPRRWILERRMHAIAAELLADATPLAVLAESHGYGDVRLLVRQFRQVMGLPPGRFRAEHRGGV
ncbi:MAG: hypothetical protein RLZZ127_403 [Planctomycetota bacterium]|jgi:AraC-like DNA-binding protein